MSDPDPAPAICRWDVGFFIKGIRPEHRLGTTYLRMAQFDKGSEFVVRNLAKNFVDFAQFARNPGVWGVQMVGVRLTANGEMAAIENAWRILSHLLDGYSVMVDPRPEIAPLLLLRKESEANVEVRGFSDKAWMSWGPKDPALAKSWEERCTSLLQHFLPFYERVLDNMHQPHTPLENQLMHSLRACFESREYFVSA